MFFGGKLKKSSIFGEKYKSLKLKEIFSQNTEEFCRETTLHGMKYVADNELRSSERCFFGFSIITVIVAVIYLIANVYAKWSTTPVIVGINPEPTFIANEPFPAVTICNLNQALKTIAKTFSKNSTEYMMLQLLCKRKVHSAALKSNKNWNNVEKFIIKISQPCEDMFINCQFGGKIHKCSKLFVPLVTDEGFCCIFNMLHPRHMYVSHIPLPQLNISNRTIYNDIDWYAETGYPDHLPPLYYPSKIPGVGKSLGLSVVIDVQQDKYYCSSSSSIGFKFSLHSPNESPNVHQSGIFIEPGKETKLRIRPEKTESDPNVRGIHRKLRQCLFHNEGKLKFYAHYTQRNCEMECVAEMSLKYCGCISFFMPQIYNNATVCSINEVKCERAVRLGTYGTNTTCLDDCLPGCFEMNYQVGAFSTKLARSGFVTTTPRVGNRSRSYMVKNAAIVHMYFKENTFRSHKQTEFIGFSDFLSSIGGLMGLFLGFSFLSIAECIYYAIIRPWRSVRIYQKSIVVENGLSKYPSSLARSKFRRILLRKRYRKLLSSSKASTDRTPLFAKRLRPPYSNDNKFDVHLEEQLRCNYCE